MNSVRRVGGEGSGAMGPRRRGNFIVGCLAVVGLLALIGIIAAVIIGPRLPGLLRGAGAEGLRQLGTVAINETDLPADEKPEMVAHIDRVAEGVKDGSIGLEQFGTLMEDLFTDPIFQVGIVYTIDEGYLKPSGLPEEEKAEGSTQLKRFAQGILEGSIAQDALNNAAAPVGSTDAEGDFSLNAKAGVTDDQLRQVIGNAARLADSAGVPAEPRVIDLSDEFGRVIAESLGEPIPVPAVEGETPPAPDAAPSAEEPPATVPQP